MACKSVDAQENLANYTDIDFEKKSKSIYDEFVFIVWYFFIYIRIKNYIEIVNIWHILFAQITTMYIGWHVKS